MTHENHRNLERNIGKAALQGIIHNPGHMGFLPGKKKQVYSKKKKTNYMMKQDQGETSSHITQGTKIVHFIYLINPRTGNNRKSKRQDKISMFKLRG